MEADEDLLDALLVMSPDFIAVDNSQVQIGGRTMDKITARGMRMLPAICRRMREPNLSFDALVRYYSAADQIVRNADPLRRGVYWEGGAGYQEVYGHTQFVPDGQDPDLLETFKANVINDICRRTALLAFEQ